MKNKDKIDQYLEEHRKLLSDLAKLAVDHPEMIDELRKMMRLSSSFMSSDGLEAIEGFNDTVKDATAFLKSCQIGEINPENFIIKDEGAET